MTAGAGHAAGLPALLHRCAHWDRALANLETGVLAVLILGSLAVSLLQIGLRNIGAAALPAVDTAVRGAVLWIAFLGASLATHRGSHLAIDVAEQVLLPRANRRVAAAAALVAAVVTALLTVAAVRFVAAELAFAGPAGAAATAVMPLGFAVMTLRFLLGAARRLAAGAVPPPAPSVRTAGAATAPVHSLRRLRRTGGRAAAESAVDTR